MAETKSFGDNLNTEERLIVAVARFEVQIDTLTDTLGELSRTVKVLADDYSEIKATVKQIQSTETHSPLSCEKCFNKVYVRLENFKDEHDNAHRQIEKDRNLKTNNVVNYWKIFQILLAVAVIFAFISPLLK